MIQFAINSTERKRMMLKDIYAWIEDHFPYFKHVAKPGWKVRCALVRKKCLHVKKAQKGEEAEGKIHGSQVPSLKAKKGRVTWNIPIPCGKTAVEIVPLHKTFYGKFSASCC